MRCFLDAYDELGGKINKFTQYVDQGMEINPKPVLND